MLWRGNPLPWAGGKTKPTVWWKRNGSFFNLFESLWDIKVLARRGISDVTGVAASKGFEKDFRERAIHERQRRVTGYARAKHHKPTKQDKNWAKVTGQLRTAPSGIPRPKAPHRTRQTRNPWQQSSAEGDEVCRGWHHSRGNGQERGRSLPSWTQPAWRSLEGRGWWWLWKSVKPRSAVRADLFSWEENPARATGSSHSPPLGAGNYTPSPQPPSTNAEQVWLGTSSGSSRERCPMLG